MGNMVLIRRVVLASTYRVKPVYISIFPIAERKVADRSEPKITCRFGPDYIVLSMVALRMVR